MGQKNDKFTTTEYILGTFAFLGVDGLCILIDVTVVGLAIAPVIQTVATFGIDRWVKGKGGGANITLGKQIAKYLSNVLPVVPTTAVIFFWSAYSHNHPKIAGIAEAAAGKKLPAITSTKDIAASARQISLPEPIK